MPKAALAGALNVEDVAGVELNGRRRDLLEEVCASVEIATGRFAKGMETHG